MALRLNGSLKRPSIERAGLLVGGKLGMRSALPMCCTVLPRAYRIIVSNGLRVVAGETGLRGMI
jgi:hypothetical protein